jgi:hypothetical protein
MRAELACELTGYILGAWFGYLMIRYVVRPWNRWADRQLFNFFFRI